MPRSFPLRQNRMIREAPRILKIQHLKLVLVIKNGQPLFRKYNNISLFSIWPNSGSFLIFSVSAGLFWELDSGSKTIFGPTKAVPPTRSGFPDFGPDPDFFDQTGPDLVRNLVRSPDFSKNCQTNAWNWLLLAPFERVSRTFWTSQPMSISRWKSWRVWIFLLSPDSWCKWSGFGPDLVWILIFLVWNPYWRHRYT